MTPRPLSETSFIILMGLSKTPATPQHGYALIQTVNHDLGREVLLPGALYTTLPKLLEAKLVEEVQAPAGNTDTRRRFYMITPDGLRVAVAHAREQASMARAVIELAGLSGSFA